MFFVIFSKGPLVFYTIFIMSWIRSFQGEVLADESEVYKLYQYQGIAGCLACFLTLGFFGKLADKISPKIFLPLTFIVRAVSFFMAFKIKDPRNWPFYLIAPFMHLTYHLVIMVYQAYLTQMYPREILGMMNSFNGIVGILGGIIYLNLCNYLN